MAPVDSAAQLQTVALAQRIHALNLQKHDTLYRGNFTASRTILSGFHSLEKFVMRPDASRTKEIASLPLLGTDNEDSVWSILSAGVPSDTTLHGVNADANSSGSLDPSPTPSSSTPEALSSDVNLSIGQTPTVIINSPAKDDAHQPRVRKTAIDKSLLHVVGPTRSRAIRSTSATSVPNVQRDTPVPSHIPNTHSTIEAGDFENNPTESSTPILVQPTTEHGKNVNQLEFEMLGQNSTHLTGNATDGAEPPVASKVESVGIVASDTPSTSMDIGPAPAPTADQPSKDTNIFNDVAAGLVTEDPVTASPPSTEDSPQSILPEKKRKRKECDDSISAKERTERGFSEVPPQKRRRHRSRKSLLPGTLAMDTNVGTTRKDFTSGFADQEDSYAQAWASLLHVPTSSPTRSALGAVGATFVPAEDVIPTSPEHINNPRNLSMTPPEQAVLPQHTSPPMDYTASLPSAASPPADAGFASYSSTSVLNIQQFPGPSRSVGSGSQSVFQHSQGMRPWPESLSAPSQSMFDVLDLEGRSRRTSNTYAMNVHTVSEPVVEWAQDEDTSNDWKKYMCGVLHFMPHTNPQGRYRTHPQDTATQPPPPAQKEVISVLPKNFSTPTANETVQWSIEAPVLTGTYTDTSGNTSYQLPTYL